MIKKCSGIQWRLATAESVESFNKWTWQLLEISPSVFNLFSLFVNERVGLTFVLSFMTFLLFGLNYDLRVVLLFFTVYKVDFIIN